MSSTYKMITVIGTSGESFEAAINSALADASETLRNLSWFEVKELRGRVQEDRTAEFQVKLQVGFKVDAS